MIKTMDMWLIVCVLGILGLMFGSFVGATVWRLRARQLRDDKKTGEPVDAKEYEQLKPLTRETISTDRSRCLHCGHTLAWYDLLPLVSWLGLRGRCRYCKAPIGAFELVTELGMSAVFVASYLLWPEPISTPSFILHFGLWLSAVVLLAILFAYDLKWFLLPDRIVFPLIGIAALTAILFVAGAENTVGAVLSVAGAVFILSGLYYFLWLISKGQWVGFGDVKLGLALALLLGDWRLAFIALFSANLIGSIVVIPGMIAGKIDRKAHVPFGPLLIAGAVVAMLLGSRIIAWYQPLVF